MRQPWCCARCPRMAVRHVPCLRVWRWITVIKQLVPFRRECFPVPLCWACVCPCVRPHARSNVSIKLRRAVQRLGLARVLRTKEDFRKSASVPSVNIQDHTCADRTSYVCGQDLVRVRTRPRYDTYVVAPRRFIPWKQRRIIPKAARIDAVGSGASPCISIPVSDRDLAPAV